MKKERKEIDALNANYRGFRVLQGAEAHNVAGLSMMRFGLAVARRAWLEPRQVLNARPLKDLLKRAGRGRVTPKASS